MIHNYKGTFITSNSSKVRMSHNFGCGAVSQRVHASNLLYMDTIPLFIVAIWRITSYEFTCTLSSFAYTEFRTSWGQHCIFLLEMCCICFLSLPSPPWLHASNIGRFNALFLVCNAETITFVLYSWVLPR
jgi:hypothetical protein